MTVPGVFCEAEGVLRSSWGLVPCFSGLDFWMLAAVLGQELQTVMLLGQATKLAQCKEVEQTGEGREHEQERPVPQQQVPAQKMFAKINMGPCSLVLCFSQRS